MKKLLWCLCLFGLMLNAKDKVVDYTKAESWTNLEKYLVDSKGKKIKDIDLASKDYYMIYFSASWCPPCRKFTPSLVEYYNKHAKEDNFELIFYTSDRSEKASEKYMQDYKMAWPTVKFSKMKYTDLKKFGGAGIPRLVLIDKEGKVIADSYEGKKYKGPSVALKKMDELKGR